MHELVSQILSLFSSNQLFDQGVELIGSWCFFLYQKHLGARSYPFRTVDIDFLISHPYKGNSKVDLVEELEKLGFRYSFAPDGSIFLWSSELKIEFLAPERGRGEKKAINVKALGIKATPLRFLDMLLKDPIFVEEDGIKIAIPNPACFCLHKLLICSRRRTEDKTQKDIQQALRAYEISNKEYLIHTFGSFPATWKRKIIQALDLAASKNPLNKQLAEDINVTLQI